MTLINFTLWVCICALVGMAVCLVGGIGIGIGYEQNHRHSCPKPTIPYVQQLLIDEGYDLGESGADGVCGEKTAIAWTEWSQATIEHENYLKCK